MNYIKPTLEIINFSTEDVIQTSSSAIPGDYPTVILPTILAADYFDGLGVNEDY